MFKKLFNSDVSEPVLVGVYVIRDIVADKFGIPVQMETDELAKRKFADFLSQASVYPHRFDFELVHVADYCPVTSTFYPLSEDERFFVYYQDISEEVDRLYSEMLSGAAVGVKPPQDASSDH